MPPLFAYPQTARGQALFALDHMMAHREYFAVMLDLPGFSALPYRLDPAIGADRPAQFWNLYHQQAHDDFNRDLPSNYNNGYYLEPIPPTPPPPPAPPPPSYLQAYALNNPGTVGIPQHQILLEGTSLDPWWLFANEHEHYIANNAILPLPTWAPTTAGTPPGVADVSNPWWWVDRAPVRFPFW